MASTIQTSANALTKKVFDEKLHRDVLKAPYFSKFMGPSQDSPVQVKTQLEKSKGDKVTFGLRMRLTGSGQTSGSKLEGNEEALTSYDCSVTLEQYRHAVRTAGKLDVQRAVWDMPAEARQAIKDWGTEKIDSLCFTALLSSPTKAVYLTTAGVPTFTTAATAKAALSGTVAQQGLSTSLISAAKGWAKTGGNRAYVPFRPFKVEGKDYYVLLVHPEALYDLKQTSAFQQAMREAEVRGKDNPLFNNSVAIWDGVVVHEHENVTVADDGGGSTYHWNSGVLFGAQALVLAWGNRGEVIEESFDYKNEVGYAWDMIMGVTKSKFNSLDFGSLAVYTRCTALA